MNFETLKEKRMKNVQSNKKEDKKGDGESMFEYRKKEKQEGIQQETFERNETKTRRNKEKVKNKNRRTTSKNRHK